MSDVSQGDGWWQASDQKWYPPQEAPVVPVPAAAVPAATVVAGPDEKFRFDAGAGSYIGTAILAFLLSVLTLGLGTPWAATLWMRWATKHTSIGHRQLRFNGSGMGLFGRWLLWLLLTIITFGIYSFWVVPRFVRWAVTNVSFADAGVVAELAPE